jgi:aarF domain-containing kinase
MAQIDDNIKYGMIEAISHLVHRDYDAIVEDFVTLDFIPPGTDLKPILPALARVFDQALEGGGAKSINFQEIAADLAQITFDFPFRIPPYFALIIRALGVLEGIALVGDPDFALVDEAFPYISKRLMTDDSPRLREALRYMVYGKNSVFDADRLIDLLDAFETFTEASKSARGDLDLNLDVVPSSSSSGGGGVINGVLTRSAGISSSLNNSLSTIFGNGNGGGGFSPLFSPETLASNPAGALLAAPLAFALAPAAFATSIINNNSNGSFSMGETGDIRTREALKFVFSPEGSYFREFLLDEVVKSIDALSRDQMRQLLSVLGLQNMTVPLLVPGLSGNGNGNSNGNGNGGGGSGVVSLAPPLNDEDRAVVENVAKIVNFLAGGSISKAINPGALRELLPYLPGLATEIIPELSRRLVSRIAARAVREALA